MKFIVSTLIFSNIIVLSLILFKFPASCFETTTRIHIIENKEHSRSNIARENPRSITGQFLNEVTVQQIFDRYIEAIGGVKKVQSITNYIQTGKMIVAEIEMNTELIVKIPNRSKLTVSVGPNTVMQQIVSGNEGITIQQGQQKPLTPQEVLTTLTRVNFLSCYELDCYGLTAQLLGVMKLDNESCYLVAVSDTQKVLYIDYYSVESGLKIGSYTTHESALGHTVVWSKYKNPTNYDGVILPAYTEQTVGNQKSIFLIEHVELNAPLENIEFDW